MKGGLGGRFPEPIRLGIEQHRRLDTFAARNPHYLRSRRRLDPRYAHWRGILADVFYDHFLAVAWDAVCTVPLHELVRRAEEDLQRNRSFIPPEAYPLLMRLLHDWIPTYGSIDGIDQVLLRMSHRIKRENPLGEGVGELRSHYAGLQEDFRLFLADFLSL